MRGSRLVSTVVLCVACSLTLTACPGDDSVTPVPGISDSGQPATSTKLTDSFQPATAGQLATASADPTTAPYTPPTPPESKAPTEPVPYTPPTPPEPESPTGPYTPGKPSEQSGA